MGAVLGIDAAWTEGNPSGVALAAEVRGRWACLAVAPSYDRFSALASGALADGGQWGPRPAGGSADVPALLAASKVLLERAGVQPTIDVVAVDMPLSPTPITARRAADNATSRALGCYKCGVHSPASGRPGALGAALTNACVKEGFPLAVSNGQRPRPALLEAYPHAVFVGLQVAYGGVPRAEAERCKYKVSRSGQFWPDLPIEGRLAFLLHNFREMHGLLGKVLAVPAIPLPLVAGTTLARLKPFEDGLDALACCVLGIGYLKGRATGLGDAQSAIWIPDNI